MGGDLDDLSGARALLDALHESVWESDVSGAQGPVPPHEVALLRGDLTLEPYHLYETHVSGGDGATALLPTVSDDQLAELIGYAEEIGLWLLPVALGSSDLERAQRLGLQRVMLTQDPFAGRGAATARKMLAELSNLKELLPTEGQIFGRVRLTDTGELGALGVCTSGVVASGLGALAPEVRRSWGST